MNKRMLTLGAAVVITGALMVTSAFAGMTNTSAGYEALKEAHKQEQQIDSLTTDAKLVISDGGQSIMDLQSTIKFNTEQEIGSGMINVTQNGETFTLDGYANKDQLVLKTSEVDTYFVLEHDAGDYGKDERHYPHDPAMAKDAERIMDALIGHNKSYFQLEEGPGHSSVVKLSMHDDEIPLIINTLGSILIKAASTEHSTASDMPQHPAFAQLDAIALPELTEDISLSGIDFTTVINADQFIEQYDLLIQASGKDAKGEQHELEFNLQLNFSDFNQTVVDAIDLTGKQVEKLDKDQLSDLKHHR